MYLVQIRSGIVFLERLDGREAALAEQARDLARRGEGREVGVVKVVFERRGREGS